MSVSINGTNGLTFSDGTSQNTAATGFGFKNRIINGAMMIDQRSAGASTSVTTSSTYASCDRWYTGASANNKYTIQQNAGSVTPPSGFTNYIGITSSAATSVGATDYYYLSQRIEGYNVADLGFGTANAKTVSLSFWVRSSLTGTFSVTLYNNNGDRFYPATYVINSANTWEQKTITIAGDTSGTWLTNNGIGMHVYFSLGMGSNYTGTANTWSSLGYAATGATSVVGTNGATFYITGVQLEKGSTATSFDYRPYGTELALCQRYYQKVNQTMGRAQSATWTDNNIITYKVSMRAAPTLDSGASFVVSSGSAGVPAINITTGAPASGDAQEIYNASSNWGAGNPYVALVAGFNAEL